MTKNNKKKNSHLLENISKQYEKWKFKAVTRSKIISEYKKRIIELGPGTGGTTKGLLAAMDDDAVVNEPKVVAALEKATAEIDSYIADRYPLPLPSTRRQPGTRCLPKRLGRCVTWWFLE